MINATKKFALVVFMIVLASTTSVFAQGSAVERSTSSASQMVSVEVPTVVRLQRPSSRTVTVNASDPVSFSETQNWSVVSNATSGARMTLSARSLTGDSGSSGNVPVHLRLEKGRGANWTVPRKTDTSSSGKAMVRARSNGPGHASFRLTVSVANPELRNLDQDIRYSTTVVGTVKKR